MLRITFVAVLFCFSLFARGEESAKIDLNLKDSIAIQEKQLKEIEVNAKSIIKTEDKRIVYPSKRIKDHSTNGYSLLYNLMLPQFEVDPLEKTITTIRGDVLICINGRKAMKDEILSINPKDVLRIDCYSKRNNPEHPEATDVLDFITIKRDAGVMVSFSGTQHLNKLAGEYSAMVHTYTKNSEFSIGTLTDFLNYSNSYSNVKEEFKFPSYSILRNTIGEPALQKNNKRAGYGAYNYKDKNTSLDLSLEYIEDNPIEDLNAIYDFGIDSIEKYKVYNHSAQSNREWLLNTHLSERLKNDQVFTLEIEASHIRNQYDKLYQESSMQNIFLRSIESNVSESLQMFHGQLFYQKTFTDKSSFSANLISHLSNTTIRYQKDVFANEQLNTFELLGFLAYRKNWKDLSFYCKLGYSQTHFNQSDTISKTYKSFLPTISLEYKLNETSSLELSEYMYNNSPSLDLQSKVQQSIDFMQANRGNPNVRQLNIFDNFLVYNLNLSTINLMAVIRSYNIYNNTVRDVFNENGIFIHTYKTDGQFHRFNPFVSSNFTFFKERLSTKLEGSWSRSWLTGGNKLTLSQWSFNGDLSYTINAWMLTIGYDSPYKMLTNSGRIHQNSACYDFNASYAHHNLTITLGARNPFSKSNLTYIFSAEDYYIKDLLVQNRMGDHQFFATFNYNFQLGAKHKYQNKEIKTEIKSAIVKGDLNSSSI